MDTNEFLNREISEDYQVFQKHGDGGCSIVYDAYRNSDQKHVAIKVLYLPESLAPEEAELTKQRFCVEALIMRTLHDEHIVECVDYGAYKGSPCIILEFIEGKQLDDYLREFGGVPFEYACNIIRQLLMALKAAHGKGIIHRDIKPANIMIIEDGNKPIVRLFDFGIATMTEGPASNLVRTHNGVIRGTPSYMAPELFSGDTRATVESDLYAVGLILLECLTGQVTVAGVTVMEIAFKQAHEDLVIPSFIPKCLAKVILKCCHKNPAERYHSAEEMLEAIDKALPEAIAQRDTCEYEYLEDIKNGGKKKKSKLPLFIALVAVLVIISVSLGMILGRQQPQQPQQPQESNGSADTIAPTPAEPAQPEAPAVVEAPPSEAPVPEPPAPEAPAVEDPAAIAAPLPDTNDVPEQIDPIPEEAPTPETEVDPAAEVVPPAPETDEPVAEKAPKPKPSSKPKRQERQAEEPQNTAPAAKTDKNDKSSGKKKDTTVIPSNLF